MPMDRFLIAPFKSGLQNDLKPWLLPEDAFEQLNNAYVFRGRVRKRFGSLLTGTGGTALTAPFFSRLGVNLGPTVAGALAGKVPGHFFVRGMAFVIDTIVYTVVTAGVAQPMLKTGATTTATFSTTDGAFNFVGAPAGDVYFYSSEPVMGISNYESGAVNDHPAFAFDTQFAYYYLTSRWVRNGSPIWHGADDDFFWAANWEDITANAAAMFVSNFFVTNYNSTATLNDDPIWAYRGGTTWVPFSYSPLIALNAGNQQPYTVTRATASTGAIVLNYVQTARIILPFKDRLVLLNTVENNANGATAYDVANPTTTGITPDGGGNYVTSTNTNYVNRCRFSHNGSPFARNAWLEPNQVFKPDLVSALVKADGGGFIDAPTEEEIISAEFIKDRLIVYFERSTWELAYTGNQVLPFVWQKINTELGSEATFSSVPFDKVILTIGNTGVHACNGANVERIDDKIPDEVFDIRNKVEGVQRVAGIRDYFTEMVYWTFPASTDVANFPNRVLVYNYQNGAWAFNNDCITAFGYFEQQSDRTWAEMKNPWLSENTEWVSGVQQSKFRRIIAGNQQGFIFMVATDSDQGSGQNARVMQITNMSNVGTAITVFSLDHTLVQNEYVAIESAQGITPSDPLIPINDAIFQVLQVTDKDNVVLGLFGDDPKVVNFTGVYTGAGTLRRVSNIQILSKQWNPYVDQGRNVYIAKIDFGVTKTEDGEITVDYFPSSTELSMIDAGQATNAILGNNILETHPYPVAIAPLEEQQTRLWHPVYFQSDGECVQINITMSDAQMRVPAIAYSDFEIDGMILHTQPTASRLQ